MFTAALFMIAKECKKLKRPSTGEGEKKGLSMVLKYNCHLLAFISVFLNNPFINSK